MSRPIQDAYIVAATRTPVGKRKGMLRNVRPDDMLAHERTYQKGFVSQPA